MHINDAMFLEDLCQSSDLGNGGSRSIDLQEKLHIAENHLNQLTMCYHVARVASTTKNCVPACLSYNGDKSDENALYWYENKVHDPRRAMAIRA